MYNRPICGRSIGAYTNLGDLQRDLMGVKSPHQIKKIIKNCIGLLPEVRQHIITSLVSKLEASFFDPALDGLQKRELQVHKSTTSKFIHLSANHRVNSSFVDTFPYP
jgi:hypothetical protein